MQKIVEHLKTAPDSVLDASMQPLISSWSNPPKAIEVLEVLDKCVHSALACTTAIMALEVLFNEALEREGVSEAQIFSQAPWRNQ